MKQMKQMKQHVLKLAVILTLLAPVSAFAGTMTGGATMPEQIVQEATMIMQYAQQVEGVKMQIQQVYDAAQNLQQVPNSLWQQGSQYLGQLVTLTSQAQSLGLGAQNLSSQFTQQYPGYSSQGLATQQQYQQWGNSFNNSVAGSLQADNLSMGQFQNEQQSLQTIQHEPVAGRLQALEVGNQIAGTTATQLGQLGVLVAKQQKSQGAYQEQMSQSKDNNQKAEEKFTSIQQSTAQNVINNPNG
jgi:P-type conjugative transfer protein TrbJ